MRKKIRGTFVMIGECFRMSMDNILGNKVRSFLTLLGIMIGVTAVIALISTVSGVSGSLASSVGSLYIMKDREHGSSSRCVIVNMSMR